jgi:hypothetical protein
VVRSVPSGNTVLNEPERRGPAMEKKDPAERGPGASSGLEEQAHERVVPGTESAEEGYESDAESGTREGDPIAGVERDADES